ncbi:MAG: bifunctional demethylmenaquinone methyltransferase/2-methoxy-6-polyprenyl-1,4-benzoquinol methylase UbiE [Gammaproteobacteria bacterium]|nr:MAG: bifunctional demethylmenaquinone methyltransferase/2-methoxy-6-polyprenyl-1,4-benzoquinol methylase UbiE [Gammaproteobacteria bacterium]
MTKTHFGYKQVETKDKASHVAEVFHSVANKYDTMNDLMSLGLHHLWKKLAIDLCQFRPGNKALDVAGGTGDLAIRMAEKVGKKGQVILSDINYSMLQEGRNKVIDSGHFENIQLCQLDAEKLPFPDNFFDCITIGFGLRNVTDKDAALRSFYRCLKPGGRAIILEFSHVTSELLQTLYDSYSFRILPKLGKMIANDEDSYQYLAESIRMHPAQEELKQMMQDAGFERCDYHNLSSGIVAVHKGYKF